MTSDRDVFFAMVLGRPLYEYERALMTRKPKTEPTVEFTITTSRVYGLCLEGVIVDDAQEAGEP